MAQRWVPGDVRARRATLYRTARPLLRGAVAVPGR
jgi:hypothetical protein